MRLLTINLFIFAVLLSFFVLSKVPIYAHGDEVETYAVEEEGAIQDVDSDEGKGLLSRFLGTLRHVAQDTISTATVFFSSIGEWFTNGDQVQGEQDDLGYSDLQIQKIDNLPGKYEMRMRTKAIKSLRPHEHDVLEDSITDEGHGITIKSEALTLPEDVWVTSFDTVIHNAPYSTLHHSVLWRIGQGNPVCDLELDIPVRHIYVAANDVAQARMDFPQPYGFFLPKDTPLIFHAMVHNPLPPYGPGDMYENVYVEVVIQVQKASDTDRSMPLEYIQLALRDKPCEAGAQSIFSVPPSTKGYIKTADRNNPNRTGYYKFDSDGVLLALGSHLHPWEGGKSVDVYINDQRLTTLTSSRTSLDPWSWFSPRIFLYRWIKQGDEIHISAEYDNESDREIKGAMGMIGFYFSTK